MVGDILQPTHLLFILVVALLVLGPKRLPEVGRQLGNGLRDFRAAINGERIEHRDEEPPEAFVPERFESAVPEEFGSPEHEVSLEQPEDASHEVSLEQPESAERQPAPRT